MLRRIISCVACAMLLAGTPLPATAAINYQDMWWAGQSESGWGVNIAQQNNTLFATWFIYGANSQPLWLVMSNAQRSGASGNTFVGDLFQTTGTPFSTIPFVPLQASNVTKVGTATVGALTAGTQTTVSANIGTQSFGTYQLTAKVDEANTVIEQSDETFTFIGGGDYQSRTLLVR